MYIFKSIEPDYLSCKSFQINLNFSKSQEMPIVIRLSEIITITMTILMIKVLLCITLCHIVHSSEPADYQRRMVKV